MGIQEESQDQYYNNKIQHFLLLPKSCNQKFGPKFTFVEIQYQKHRWQAEQL